MDWLKLSIFIVGAVAAVVAFGGGCIAGGILINAIPKEGSAATVGAHLSFWSGLVITVYAGYQHGKGIVDCFKEDEIPNVDISTPAPFTPLTSAPICVFPKDLEFECSFHRKNKTATSIRFECNVDPADPHGVLTMHCGDKFPEKYNSSWNRCCCTKYVTFDPPRCATYKQLCDDVFFYWSRPRKWDCYGKGVQNVTIPPSQVHDFQKECTSLIQVFPAFAYMRCCSIDVRSADVPDFPSRKPSFALRIVFAISLIISLIIDLCTIGLIIATAVVYREVLKNKEHNSAKLMLLFKIWFALLSIFALTVITRLICFAISPYFTDYAYILLADMGMLITCSAGLVWTKLAVTEWPKWNWLKCCGRRAKTKDNEQVRKKSEEPKVEEKKVEPPEQSKTTKTKSFW